MKRLLQWTKQEWIAGLLLAGLLLLSIPLMLAMPLTADPVLYDLQARCVLEGGVLYRDIVEPNLPGIVWLHIAIRSLFGWSEMALKAVDLIIIASIVYLLVRWPSSSSQNQSEQKSRQLTASLLLATLLFWFYFGTSEWCHCQRDPWMLLPALGALFLRRQQIIRISTENTTNRQLWTHGFFEGVLWAVGFWIKPFIAVPALAAMTVGVCWNRKAWRQHLADFSGILCGGLLIGTVGTGWLITSGTWSHFWEMAIEWNPTYFEVGRERWTWDRLLREQYRFFPFSLCHLFAIPWSVWTLFSLRKNTGQSLQRDNALLAGVYLGWLLQTFTLQHLFDYIHVPEVLLAITITVRNFPATCREMLSRYFGASDEQVTACSWLAVSGLILLAVLYNPATRWQRVAVWAECCYRGSTPEVKTALQHFPLPDWTELQPALDYLAELHLKDGQLTVHNVYLVHAYAALQLKPSTRFVYLDVLSRVFRSRGNEIVESLDQSGHRYILSSLLENGLTLQQSRETDPEDPHQLPASFPEEHLHEFPYNQPVVFRSGQYVVHRVETTAAPINPQFAPLSVSTRVEQSRHNR